MTRIIRSKDMEYERGHCGNIKKLIDDRQDVSFVYLEVDKSEEHYHKVTTEFYFVLEGKGKVKLDGKAHEISAGDIVEITPETRHKAFDEKGLKILVIMVPRLKDDDNHFV